jgi:D-sedoheptulose 7-phosphate isomerase
MSIRSSIDVRAMLKERADLFARVDPIAAGIESAGRAIISSLRAAGTVWTCGNGGSAAEAQHFAAELVGRFKRERSALRVVCLADNMATLTSVANDYEFEHVFARQVTGLASRGDCLLAFSTSGNSENVVRACTAARGVGATVIALTGAGGGRVAEAADIVIRVPDDDTPRIQEVHLVAVHILCDLIESAFANAGHATPGAL